MLGSQRRPTSVPYVPAPHAYFLGNTPTVNTASSFWLVDAGASHHVSMDLQNLASHSKYDDIDEITVGNGNNLNITHTSSTHLSSSSKSFLLSNVLCVPSMQRNLLSVSQFCTTNNASIEFFHDCFVVKDLQTGAILLRESLKGGSYEYHPLPPPNQF